jgi:hypothetical protein
MQWESGQLCATYTNSKLTQIKTRKSKACGGQQPIKQMQPPLLPAVPGGVNNTKAANQKYALIFHIDPFEIANVGKFDLWVRLYSYHPF